MWLPLLVFAGRLLLLLLFSGPGHHDSPRAVREEERVRYEEFVSSSPLVADEPLYVKGVSSLDKLERGGQGLWCFTS